MLRTALLNQFRFHRAHRFASSSASSMGKDHYSTLGISRTATPKEIKSAFYELSKKYHPDRNPDDKASASIKFQDVLNAYEVLSNTDKKREYDRQFVTPRNAAHPFARRDPGTQRAKNYTDLDLDYRDLEHFQRMARRRRFTSQTFETSDDFLKQSERYTSTLAAERERAERILREELEERRRQARYKTPSFEELLQAERRRKIQQFNKQMGIAAVVSFIGVVLITLFTGRSSPAR